MCDLPLTPPPWLRGLVTNSTHADEISLLITCVHGTHRFATPTESVAAPRSKVAAEMFLAMTRTVLLDQAAASS